MTLARITLWRLVNFQWAMSNGEPGWNSGSNADPPRLSPRLIPNAFSKNRKFVSPLFRSYYVLFKKFTNNTLVFDIFTSLFPKPKFNSLNLIIILSQLLATLLKPSNLLEILASPSSPTDFFSGRMKGRRRNKTVTMLERDTAQCRSTRSRTGSQISGGGRRSEKMDGGWINRADRSPWGVAKDGRPRRKGFLLIIKGHRPIIVV